MKFLFLTAALGTTILGGAAIAQGADPIRHGPHRPMFERLDTNRDGVITRAEATAAADRAFGLLDINKDGRISRDEIDSLRAALGELGRGQRGGHRRRPGFPPPSATGEAQQGGAPQPLRRHPGEGERADANKDGTISRDEFRAHALARFDRLDVNKDGKLDAAEVQAMKGHRNRHRKGGGHWGRSGDRHTVGGAADQASPLPTPSSVK